MRGRGRILTGPKSEAGRRIVALPAVVAETLSDHLDTYVSPEPDRVPVHPAIGAAA